MDTLENARKRTKSDKYATSDCSSEQEDLRIARRSSGTSGKQNELTSFLGKLPKLRKL
jgi:hypothetical protein